MNDISVVAVFCSDVRTEKGGTETIVGVYPDRVNLPQIPGAFAQMAIYVRMHLRTTYRPVEITTRIVLPDGSELERSSMAQSLMEQTRQKAIERGAPLMGLIAKFQVAPLRITQEGRILAIVSVDGEDIIAGALHCVVISPSA